MGARRLRRMLHGVWEEDVGWGAWRSETGAAGRPKHSVWLAQCCCLLRALCPGTAQCLQLHSTPKA